MSDLFMEKSANISDCGSYRYALTRRWDGKKHVLTFVMLNPSTADADLDDPTIRRCMGFAKREGYGGILVVNIYAYRATDPDALKGVSDPFGSANANAHRVAIEIANGRPIVCAWGTKGILLDGYRHFMRMAKEHNANLVALGITKGGHPKHPLYLKGDAPFIPFPAGRAALSPENGGENHG